MRMILQETKIRVNKKDFKKFLQSLCEITSIFGQKDLLVQDIRD